MLYMLHREIQKEVAEAMKARDAVRLNTVRGLLSAFTNELVAKGRKPTEELRDEEALEVIKRSVKQRKDSIEQFRKGGRNDLAESEEAELKILEVYLPQMMSREEIRPIAEERVKEFGNDKSKIGQIIGAVMKDLKGRADGSDVKAVVESILG